MRLKIFLFTTFFMTALLGFSQTRTITGTLVEKDTQIPIQYAPVEIPNTTFQTESDENGTFSLEIPVGEQAILISPFGYEELIVTYTAQQNHQVIELIAIEESLEELVIAVETNKGSETVILEEQRKSLEFKQEIGSEELSRKGVGDAAAAVAKTSGVSKQSSTGGVFVRGMGDRYNSTFLNGLPIVSNDPEKKNILLDIFSSDVIGKISIDKTFLTRYSGDFGGASIDIISKTTHKNGSFNIGISSNMNSNAMNLNKFYLPQGYGSYGFNSNNEVPTVAPTSYFFKTPFNIKSTNPIGVGINIDGGKKWYINEDESFSFYATLSHDTQNLSAEGADRQVSAQGAKINDYHRQTSTQNTQTTAMLNATYEKENKYLIQYNSLLLNTSNLTHDNFEGFIRDKAERDRGGIILRNTYTQNTLFTNQIIGNYQLTERNLINAGISYNTVSSAMPDRTQVSLKRLENTEDYVFITDARTDNHRYFHGLTENELAARIEADHKFAKEDNQYKGKIVLGYNARMKTRGFEANQYNYIFKAAHKNDLVNPNDIDATLNEANYDSHFTFATFRGSGAKAGEPQYYNGEQNIHAAFGRIEYQLSPKFSAVAGLRIENIQQTVEWKTQLDNNGNSSKLTKNAFLPALHLKYELNDKQNLRFAASKTYTLPQFKERAPFIYEDVTEIKFGNKDLYASDNYNVDLKWEYFPKNDELISATVFGKYIQNPINQTNIASSTNDISFANTGDYGIALGIELELRKTLFYINDDSNHKVVYGINAAFMRTEQELNPEKIARETKLTGVFTHTKSSFTGAPNTLINTDLSYHKAWNDNSIMATIAYNYGSDQIYSLGTEKKGNLVDKGFGMLDFILKTTWKKNFEIGLIAKNITNPEINRVQANANGDALVRSRKLGTNYSVSLKYKF